MAREAASCVTETVLARESEVVLPVDEENGVTKKRRVDLVCDTEKQLLRLQESGIKEERQNNAQKNDASLNASMLSRGKRLVSMAVKRQRPEISSSNTQKVFGKTSTVVVE